MQLKGDDSIEVRRAENSMIMAFALSTKTFDQCLSSYFEAKEGNWKNAKHRQQRENSLRQSMTFLLQTR